jgi:hypothetical protein
LKEKQDIRQLMVYASSVFTFSSSNLKVTMAPKPLSLIPSVTPEDVASRIRLEIPGRNQNDVALANPYSPLKFAPNPAQPFFAVLTLHQNPFSTQHLNSYP